MRGPYRRGTELCLVSIESSACSQILEKNRSVCYWHLLNYPRDTCEIALNDFHLNYWRNYWAVIVTVHVSENVRSRVSIQLLNANFDHWNSKSWLETLEIHTKSSKWNKKCIHWKWVDKLLILISIRYMHISIRYMYLSIRHNENKFIRICCHFIQCL